MESAKMHIQKMLQRAGLYHRLRTSGIHELYWRIAGKEWILARETGSLISIDASLLSCAPATLFSTSAQTRVSNPICS